MKIQHASLIMAICVALCATTACDEDEKMGLRLAGEWEGEFYSTYTCQYKSEPTPRQYYADHTYLQFRTDGFDVDQGTGIEVDYFGSGPYEYLWYEFDWKVRDEVIELRFVDAPEMDVTIEDYHLTYDRFRGRFGEGYSFSLGKMDADEYDWEWSLYKGSSGCTYRSGYSESTDIRNRTSSKTFYDNERLTDE